MGGAWTVNSISETEISYSVCRYVFDVIFLSNKEYSMIVHQNGNSKTIKRDVPYDNTVPNYRKIFQDGGLEARALEAEVRGLKKVESWKYKVWKDIKWWYGMNCHDYVVTIAKHAAAVLVGIYVVYKLGMEFIPSVMDPISNVVGRAISALLSF